MKGLGSLRSMYTFTLLRSDPNIQDVFCGGESSVIWEKDGKVWVFGDASDGQLGLGHNKAVPKFEKIFFIPHFIQNLSL